MLPFLTMLFKLLPELISLINWAIAMGEKGVAEIKIKQAIRAIDKAFEMEDPQAKAKALNDIFKK